MIRKFLLWAALLVVFGVNQAQAHCEIPCGVYDDGARFTSLMEHVTTIEKSMKKIKELSAAAKPDYHTISRWTANKEKHANEIQHIASQYFLTQRVKAPGEGSTEAAKEDYAKHTLFLHQILVAAMKTKQSLDLVHVKMLRDLTESYKAHYFKKHGHTH